MCDLQTETLIKAVFAENQQTYGSRRMRSNELAKRGSARTLQKCVKLLNTFNLKPAGSVSFVHTTDSKHTLPVAENLLNRKFNPWGLEPGLDLGHHLYSHTQRLALPGRGDGSVLTPGDWLGDGVTCEQSWSARR